MSVSRRPGVTSGHGMAPAPGTGSQGSAKFYTKGRRIYKFNGVNSRLLLPKQISLVSGDTVKFKFIAPAVDPVATQVLVSTTGADDLKFFYGSTGKFRLLQCTATVDGIATPDNAPAIYDGKEHAVVLTITVNSTLDLFGMFRGDTFFYPEAIFDIEVVHQGIDLVDIALNHKEAVQYNHSPFGPTFFPHATSDLQMTPVINLIAGDTVEIVYIAPPADTGHNDYIIDGDDANDRLFIVRNNTGGDVIGFNTVVSTLTIDGVAQVQAVTPFAADNRQHKAVLSIIAACKIGTMFSRFNNQSSNFGEMAAYDLKVIRGGNTILHIPLNEGKDAAVGGVTSIKDIDGVVVGTLNEGTGSHWSEELFDGISALLTKSENFEQASDYNLSTGVAIADGICTGTNIAALATLFDQTISTLEPDRFYDAHIIIDEISVNPQIAIRLGGNLGRVITTAGDFEFIFTAGSTNLLAVVENVDSTNPLVNVKISHFSIHEVHPVTGEIINFDEDDRRYLPGIEI